MSDKDETSPSPVAGEERDISDYLRQEEAIAATIKEKFQHHLAVMFTDLKGSTAIAEKHGDLASRKLMQQHNDIVFPAVAQFRGTLVKSIGDGTLSHFESAQDALRAAVQIQRGIDLLNHSGKLPMPVLIRIGIHTGDCILEKNDIFGDVVNTASRFESSANPGEILFSEDTYNALEDKAEIYCRYDRAVTLKGKAEPFNAYKAFWSPEEIEIDRSGGMHPPVSDPVGTRRYWLRYALVLAALGLLILGLSVRDKFSAMQGEVHRSISHGDMSGK